MNASQSNRSVAKPLIRSLLFIGVLSVIGFATVTDMVICDGDACILLESNNILDGTIRKMAPVEALQFWEEAKQAAPALPGAVASPPPGDIERSRSEPVVLGSQDDQRCPPFDVQFLNFRARGLHPLSICFWNS